VATCLRKRTSLTAERLVINIHGVEKNKQIYFPNTTNVHFRKSSVIWDTTSTLYCTFYVKLQLVLYVHCEYIWSSRFVWKYRVTRKSKSPSFIRMQLTKYSPTEKSFVLTTSSNIDRLKILSVAYLAEQNYNKTIEGDHTNLKRAFYTLP